MSAYTDMVENAARAIRNRAEQPIDMAEARYLTRAALDASGIGEPVAWRYRYLRSSGPDHWIVRQSPIEAREGDGTWAGVEVEPLYALSRARATQETNSE
jgi:hypothetical protein